MQTAKFFIAAIALTAWVSAEAQEKQYSLNLSNPDAPMQLNIDLHKGNVSVQGYDGNTVEVIANFSTTEPEALRRFGHGNDKHKHKDKGKGEQRSTAGLKRVNKNNLNLEITENNNRVNIESEHGSQFIDVAVRVPRAAKVNVEVYIAGIVRLSDLTGSIEAETWQGAISASDLTGPIVAETYQHDITLTFSRFETSSPTSLTSYSGDIDVTLPGESSSKIHVATYQGEILSGLDVDFVPTEKVERDQNGRQQKIEIGGHMSATLGKGEQELRINTYSGDVYLRKEG